MPAPGNPERPGAPAGGGTHSPAVGEVGVAPDTICSCVIDAHGNAYAATVSDNSYDSPVIPGTGLTMSSRGHQSRLTADHPAGVAPGKRPRLTPSPALALAKGKIFLSFGTPGGDVQSQAMLQAFLNVTAFGMELQQAVELPRFSTANFPNSFAPHEYFPGRLCIEADMPNGVIEEMRKRGHDVQVMPSLPAAHGGVCAVMLDPVSGLRHAAADPRRTGYALAW
jgi:gamma-glutamyltranspeptidase/glutathione hydrolase